MMRAFVLLNTKPGTSAKVVNNLRATKGVLWADSLYGKYDAIAIVQGDEKVVDSIVYNVLERDPEVTDTETLVCLHDDALEGPHVEERLRSLGTLT